MISYFDLIYSRRDDLFWFFKQAFLFGSALYADIPGDLDILLVYEDGEVELAISEGKRISEKIGVILPMIRVDLTIMSETELSQTDFLLSINYVTIKG